MIDRAFLNRLVAVALTASLLAACGDDDDAPADDASAEDAPSEEGQSGPAEIELRDDTLTATVVVGELEQPTSVALLGDDEFLVTEKATGLVRHVRGGEAVGDALDLAVNSFDERGLLGITLHPDFPEEPFVYLHWTWRGAGDGPESLLGEDTDEATEVPALGNRIDRFRWEDDALTFDLNLVQLPSNTLDTDTSDRVRGNHDAGPLTFGPDGMIYLMLGDQNLRGQLQNIPDGPAPDDEHLAGVILRLGADGTVPPDNPFAEQAAAIGGEVGENLAMVWAYGVRNSFGMAFEPTSGALWQTENGDDSFDEINVFEAGANSGWIQVQGPPERFEEYKQIEVDSPDGLDNPSFDPADLADDASSAAERLFELDGSTYAPPVLSYRHPPAITAIGFVTGDALGSASADTVWVGSVLTDALLRYPLAADGRSLDLTGDLSDGVDDNSEKGDLGESEGNVVGTGFGVVTDIEQASDGPLYVLSLSSGQLLRIDAV